MLDYLRGQSAEMLLVAAARGGPEGIPIRFVQIGSAGGANITLPAAALRSSSLELLGSGINSVPLHRLVHSISEVFKAAVPHGLRIATQSVALDGIAAAWQRAGRDRLVFIP